MKRLIDRLQVLFRRSLSTGNSPAKFDFAEWATTYLIARDVAYRLRLRAAVEQVFNDALLERPLNVVLACQAARELAHLRLSTGNSITQEVS